MLTLTSLLQRNSSLHAARPAVVQEGQTQTWAQFCDRIASVAGGITNLGVQRGERLAIVSRNSSQFFELLHAAFWMGAVPVPINHRLAAPEVSAILAHADVRWVVVESLFESLFTAPQLSQWSKTLIGMDSACTHCAENYTSIAAAGLAVPAFDAAEEDIALLLYTGGTTGRSKGVPLTHLNIVSNALQVCSVVNFTGDDVYLHAAPMFHSADLLATGVTMQGGAHAFLTQFTPRDFVRVVQECAATRTMMAPAMVSALMDDPSVADEGMRTMRQLFYGSSPMQQDLVEAVLKRFPGVALAQGYGLTETAPLLTLLPMEDHLKALSDPDSKLLRSAGRALPGVDVLIGDANRHPLDPGHAGEVWVRGPNVMRHYHDPQSDEPSPIKEGWFRTGDVGLLDDQGYLTLLDRSKDMIITGGENVYSIEVEAVLQRHPAIKEVAVIGVPDRKFGEALLAIVVCKPGTTIDSEGMVMHCRQYIGGYKIPRQLKLVKQLPRSSVGKVLKSTLRQQFARNDVEQ
jgi:acyl-CoA synthetase (AMP-forming)/AMP-acid ligase II